MILMLFFSQASKYVFFFDIGLDGRDGIPGEPGLDGVPGLCRVVVSLFVGGRFHIS